MGGVNISLWSLYCHTHSLLKLAARTPLTPAPTWIEADCPWSNWRHPFIFVKHIFNPTSKWNRQAFKNTELLLHKPQFELYLCWQVSQLFVCKALLGFSIACVHAGSIKMHQNLCIWLWCVCSFAPGTVKEHHIHNEKDRICLSRSDLESPDRKWCRQLAIECCSCDGHVNKASAQRFDPAHLLQGKQRMS